MCYYIKKYTKNCCNLKGEILMTYFIQIKKILIACIVLFFIQVLFVRKADAYLDPGTGSYILQVMLAAFVAGLYVIKLFWNKIKAFFKNLFAR